MDDFMDELNRVEKKAKKRPSVKSMSSGFGDTKKAKKKAEQARGTDKYKYHGKYIQQTIRIMEDMNDAIKEVANDHGVSNADMYRWLLGRGLKAILADGEDPTGKEVVKKRLVTPEWES